MKRTMFLPRFLLIIWRCNNDKENRTYTSPDNLATNPHAVPSHVDTITHEDGLHNQSQIPLDSSVTRGRDADSILHT
jgi:hypothetical protein